MATLMRKKFRALLTSFLLITLLCSVSTAADSVSDNAPNAEAVAATYRVNSVDWGQSAESYTLRIAGGTTPTYTMYELFEPLRLIIDIADASLESTVSLPLDILQGPVSLVNGKVLEDKEPYITRIELFLREDRGYAVERDENDIIVKFPMSTEELDVLATTASDSSLSDEPTFQGVLDDGSAADAPPEVASVAESLAAPPVAEEILGADPAFSAGETATIVTAIEISHTTDHTEIYLKADGPIIEYEKVELGKNVEANRPDRMYLDLKNLRLTQPFESRTVGTALAQVRTAKKQDGFRIVFDSGLDQLFDYGIAERPDGLLVTINEPSAASSVIAGLQEDVVESELAVAPEPQLADEIVSADSGMVPSDLTFIPEVEPAKPIIAATPEKPAKTKKTIVPAAPTISDLSFTGYTKQRITVDFYKIDLHNVFRLFGEISNLNVVVAEGVGGSLTLALNDVPWDFALDIILNLKDLQKEERFNTIVISPKSKKFTWPERTLDSVEFKADIKIQQDEAQDTGGIKISKRLEVPETVVEAKKLIHQAQVNERNGNYEAALPLYEEAISKWSDNINLAKKIASICLVNLEQNAKAVYYAKSALKINPADQEAALQAAIGLARMKRDAEAKEFFAISVNGTKPPSGALISYASYCEEKLDYDCSLEMLKNNEDLYGDSLFTMVSKARVLDKQGHQDLAAKEYRAILLSGYEIPPDLARYIKGRASLGVN